MTYYNKFQLIAYQVPTDRFFKKDNNQVAKSENRLPAGNRCQIASTRLNDMEQDLTAGLSADARSRLMRMIAVAEKAAASLNIDTARNTLKIFMAPEFYFRPELKGTTSWSYTLAEKELIEKALGKVFSAKEYESWLFVFGTIVWNRTTSSLVNGAPELAAVKDDPKLAELGDTPFLWNAAIVMEGGADKAFTLVKRHYSDADDIDAQYRVESAAVARSALDGLAHKSKSKMRDYLLKLKKESPSDPIFPVGDNLTLSLEICLEHEHRVVPTAFEKLKGKYPRIDLQLVTACGMRVQERNLCIGEKQFVIRVDGAGNVIPDWPSPWDFPIEIQQVLGLTNGGVPYTSSPYAKDADRKSKWEDINTNAIAEQISLQGDLKLATGDLMAGRFKEENNKVTELQLKVDEAFPQKLIIFRAIEFEHGVAKGAENKPRDYQEPQPIVNAL